jgi:hypothetical protein
MWKSGERVLASRPGDPHLYPGTVQYPDGDKMDVIFDDGEEARVTAAQVCALTLEAGDRVEVRLPGTRTYTPATLTRRDGDRLSVDLDRGEQEWTSLGMVRVDPEHWKNAAPQPPAHSWIVGDRVLAQWSGDTFWYPGTIQGVEGGQLQVFYDDGERERRPPEKLAPLDLQIGDRVFGRWQHGAVFYPGKLTGRRGETIDILYDDGDRETTTISMVRVRRSTDIPVVWAVGQRVLAQWLSEPFYYPGAVSACDGTVVDIQFDDGGRSQVLPEQVLPLRLTLGDRVYARWQAGPNYYPAHLDQISGDDLFVTYEDNHQEWSSMALIRVLPQELTKR